MKIINSITLFSLFFLSFTVSVLSQNAEIDSLKIELENNKEQDTTKVNLLNKLAFVHYEKDINKAEEYLDESEELAKLIDFKKGKARVLYIKGKIQVAQSNFDEGLRLINEALQLYEALNDKPAVSLCYEGIGSLLKDKGERKEAIAYYLKSVQISEEIGDRIGISNIFRSIGVTYFEIGNYTEALSYYEKALQISKEINNEETASRSLMNIGNVHLIQGNYPLALEYHNKSLEINEKRKDTFLISLSLSNIGHIYNNLKNYDKALVYSKKALDIQKKIGNKKRVAEILLNLGLTYSLVKDYKQAESVLMEALTITEEIQNKHLMGFALNNIGYIYQELGDYDMSIAYYEKAIKNDLSIDGKRVLERSYYGIAKTLVYQKKYKEALHYALESKQLSQNLDIINSERDTQELLSIIYKNTGNYKKALESHEQYKILNDSLFNKKNIEKIAQLESEYKYQRALDSASIRELQLKKTVTATNKDLEKTQRNYLWAVIGVLIVSMLLGSVIFYQKLRHAKAKTHNVVIEQKLLRSQMTPHFIFNSLSVLQGMILNKEEKKSVSYLSKFSKLLRIILENSRDKTVSLSQELKAIQNYLALQNLENEAYEHTILVEDSIDVPLFEIPPMLIQPFVENAIEHAFVNKKDHMKIDIRLTYINKRLICTITDNGIGYESQNGVNNGNKKSLSTTITTERLKILSKDFKMEGSVVIKDRKQYNEQGTIVTLVIPHKIIPA